MKNVVLIEIVNIKCGVNEWKCCTQWGGINYAHLSAERKVNEYKCI